MATTNFIDKTTIIEADWLNEVDALVHDVFGAPTTDAEARTNLGVAIGSDVQAHSAILDATTASFLVADETKLGGIETGATQDQTDAEIKTAYENNADTNEFSDTEQTKLAGIEALADITDTTNVTNAGALMDSEVDADIKTLVLPASTTISAFGKTLVDDADNVAARSTIGLVVGTDVREFLSASRTYYTRTDGSNSNTGLVDSSGGAFLTIQKAINTVMNTINLNGYSVTLDVGNGTYTGSAIVDGAWTGRGKVTLVGDITTPSNVLFDVTSLNAIQIINGGVLYYGGIKLQTNTAGSGVTCSWGAVGYQNGKMDFGSCVNNHIDCQYSSAVYITADYNITGGATIHWHAGTAGANIEVVGSKTITLTGTPAFTWFAGVASGVIRSLSATITGAATGTRYLVYKNGFIDVGASSTTYFPGDVVGSQQGGGTYTYSTSTHLTGISDGTILNFINGSDAAGPSIRNEAASGSNPTLCPNKTDLTTGVGLNSAGVMALIASGARIGVISSTGILVDDTSGPAMMNEAASSTNPTLVPNRADSNTGIGWNSADKLSFVCNGTETASLDSAGVFTTGKISSIGVSFFQVSASIPVSINRTTDDGVLVNLLQDGSSEGSISISGTTTSFNTTSDIRLKENFKKIPDALSVIGGMKPWTFNFKKDPYNTVYGFAAQELNEVYPQAVFQGDGGDSMWSVDYGKLTPIMVAGIQELNNRLQRLEGKVLRIPS